ncbi:hypothetical protein GPALN_011634 [Globodera pallida]|nr:hypothetical protein GPALN_011634 [Globodera pallida]
MNAIIINILLLITSIIKEANALKVLFVQQHYLGFSSHFGFILHLAKCLAKDDDHEVHMLIPIREENYKLADKNEEIQLNVRYFMPKRPMPPSLVGVNASSRAHDKIYLDIANDLELMDELRAENFDVGITEAFRGAGYSLAIFHLLQIPATIVTRSQAMAPFHLYLLGVLSKIKTGMHSDYIGLPTMNFRPSGEDRLELLNFKSREVREEQLKLRRETIWHHYVEQTMELINEHINEDVDYQKLAEEKYGLNAFPSWDEMFRSARFFFLNSLPEVDFFQSKIVESIEKVKFIGGFNLARSSNFNANAIQNTNSLINLTLGTKEGVILISFGTVVDFSLTSAHIIEALVETMANFPNYLFIWKQPKGHVPIILKQFKFKNVVLQNWINQKELLAHPKTMAFVSHCGMNSVMESIFYGIPMVCMPFFGDQYYNAELLAFQNIGLVIETKNDKQTIQKELNLALSTALGLMKRSEEHFDLDKLKSVSVGIRQKNITKTISDAMKTIEKEINEKKRQ